MEQKQDPLRRAIVKMQEATTLSDFEWCIEEARKLFDRCVEARRIEFGVARPEEDEKARLTKSSADLARLEAECEAEEKW